MGAKIIASVICQAFQPLWVLHVIFNVGQTFQALRSAAGFAHTKLRRLLERKHTQGKPRSASLDCAEIGAKRLAGSIRARARCSRQHFSPARLADESSTASGRSDTEVR